MSGLVPEVSIDLALIALTLKTPCAGRVYCLGLDPQQLLESELQALRRRVAGIFVQDGLFPAWSAFDNLALAARQSLALTSERQVEHVVLDEAARYGIDSAWLERPVAQLSSAQRQALALWRALRARPSLVVVDGLVLASCIAEEVMDVQRLLQDGMQTCPAVVCLSAELTPRIPDAWLGLAVHEARWTHGSIECLSTDVR